MPSKNLVFYTEKRRYKFSYEVLEQDLRDIHGFLSRLGCVGDFEITYDVVFDNKNAHEISTNSIDKIIEESNSRKSSIKELTVNFDKRSSDNSDNINIKLHMEEYDYAIFGISYIGISYISTYVSCNDSFKISHDLEGYINNLENNNKKYGSLLSVAIVILFIVLAGYFKFKIEDISKTGLTEWGFISLLLVPNIYLFLCCPLLNKCFPRATFAIGHGKKIHDGNTSLRKWLFGSVITGILISLLFAVI